MINVAHEGMHRHPVTGLLIRDGRSGDRADLVRIAGEAYAQYIPRMGKPPAPMLADFAKHLRDDTVLVAIASEATHGTTGGETGNSEGQVIGFAIVLEKTDGYWLENIAVADGWRGRRVGKQLLTAVEKHVRGKADSYHLYTNVAMTENIAWYAGLGFTETERRTEAGYKRVFFCKTLR